MPDQNPYAAPQTVDQPAVLVGEMAADLSASLDSIRTGARLTLKATWLMLLACVVVGVGAALPALQSLVPLMMWILLGAAAFCFLVGMVAFWQVTPSANIRRLMQIALICFAVMLVIGIADTWVLPSLSRTARLAWNLLDKFLSMGYIVAFLLGIARLGRILRDLPVTRSANVAAWCWGSVYTFILGYNLLALNSTLRVQLMSIHTPEQRSVLVVIVIVLCILIFVGLAGFIRALWRLKRLQVAPTA